MAQSPSRTAFPLELIRAAGDQEFAPRGMNGERVAIPERFACERLRLPVLCRAVRLSREPAHAAEGFAGTRCGA